MSTEEITLPAELQRIWAGLRALDALGWLIEHHAEVDFHNSELTFGKPVDVVEVSAWVGALWRTVTCPTLEEAITELERLSHDGS
jgi:hypothetical protein